MTAIVCVRKMIIYSKIQYRITYTYRANKMSPVFIFHIRPAVGKYINVLPGIEIEQTNIVYVNQITDAIMWP